MALLFDVRNSGSIDVAQVDDLGDLTWDQNLEVVETFSAATVSEVSNPLTDYQWQPESSIVQLYSG
jgi:hypothetical protein